MHQGLVQKLLIFLLKMNMDKKYLSNVMTSGEAAMYAINKNQFGKTFFHLGPLRDTSIYEKVKDNKADLKVAILFYAQVCLMNMEIT